MYTVAYSTSSYPQLGSTTSTVVTLDALDLQPSRQQSQLVFKTHALHITAQAQCPYHGHP
eukprot:1158239-Pelagomonas_calceolata.AAC.3